VTGPVRVFVACSLDGFIAGRDNDLSWLPAAQDGEDYGYGELLAQTGAILMGRGTYDVASGFGTWPYAEMPVFVATQRVLAPSVPTVRAIRGTARELLSAVRERTGGGIYLDGGNLIRSFLDEGLVDELTVTIVGVLLGAGIPLFAGVRHRHQLDLTSCSEYPGGLVQLRYAPARRQ
jgi:dihydrofolate reductase